MACLMLLLPVLSAWAAPQFIVKHYTTLDGLSTDYTKDIFQDSRGYIWVSTLNGINRYDGYGFKNYHIGENGLKTNIFAAMTEDRHHNMWVATINRGVWIYIAKEDRFVSLNEIAPELGYIRCAGDVACDENGYIWIYAVETGLIFKIDFDTENKKVRFFEKHERARGGEGERGNVSTILATEDGVFFCCKNGLYAYNECTRELNCMMYKNHFVHGMAQVAPQKYVVSQNGLLCLIDLKTKSSKILKRSKSWTQVLFKKNWIWEVNREGLTWSRYDKKTETILDSRQVHTSNQRLVLGAFVDKEKNVWASWQGEGLFKFTPAPMGIKFIPIQQLKLKQVNQLHALSNGHMLMGDYMNGVVELDKRYRILNQIDKETTCLAIAEDTVTKELFYTKMDTISKLYVSRYGSQKRELIMSHTKAIRAVALDSTYVWVAVYGGGLVRLNRATKECANYRWVDGLNSNILRNVLVDHQGNVWIATINGVQMIAAGEKHKDAFKITNIDDPQLEKQYVLTLLEDSAHQLWIGTLDNGLFVLTHDSNGFHVTKMEDVNNNVKSIIEDDMGSIWVATGQGLDCVDMVTKSVRHFDECSNKQQMDLTELAATKDRHGHIFLGSKKGLFRVVPRYIDRDTLTYKPVLTDFFLENKSILKDSVNQQYLTNHLSVVKRITLPHNKNHFGFAFSALSYADTRKIKYKYRLVGQDKKWNYASAWNRRATYTNMRPGKYTIEILAANIPGQWDYDKVRRCDIVITPPFWATWYAIVFYMLAICGLGIAWNVYERRRTLYKQQLHMNILEKKQREKMLNMKVQLFTNVSHELRTPLTLILSPLQSLLKNSKYSQDKALQEALNAMNHNGKSIHRLIDDLLSFSKKEKQNLSIHYAYADVNKQLTALVEEFRFVTDKQDVVLVYHKPAASIELYYDAFFMEGIFHNLMSNAVKHTDAGGTITCQLVDEQSQVTLIVQDTGHGIPEEIQARLFEPFVGTSATYNESSTGGTGIGLYLTKSMVEMHEGTISCASQEGKGTIFKVSIPKLTMEVIKKRSQEQDYSVDIETKQVSTKEVYSTPEVSLVKNEIFQKEVELPVLEEDVRTTQKPILLMVDDNVEICQLVAGLFAEEYCVIQALDGVMGWELCVQHQPSIVISDIMMPRMNGYELCEKIKGDKTTSHIPVVLLSAKSTNEDIAQGYSFFADAYQPKPFDNEVLKSMVAAVMNNRRRVADTFVHHHSFEPTVVATTSTDELFLKDFSMLLDAHLHDSTFKLESYCEELGVTYYVVNKKMKALLNMSATAFIKQYRLKRAAQLLIQDEMSITDIAFAVGFADVKYFRRLFKEEYEMSPSDYRLKYQEEVAE